MAVKDHLHRTPKLRGKISTVDPSQGIIEVITTDGAARRLASFDSAPFFRWPKAGEEWTIYEENGHWLLGDRFPLTDDAITDKELQPGDALVNADIIYDGRGARLVPADLTSVEDGQTLAWDDTRGLFVAETPSTGDVQIFTSATHSAGASISIPQATHEIAGLGMIIQLREVSTGDIVDADTNVDPSTRDVTVTFTSTQSANSIRVTIIG